MGVYIVFNSYLLKPIYALYGLIAHRFHPISVDIQPLCTMPPSTEIPGLQPTVISQDDLLRTVFPSSHPIPPIRNRIKDTLVMELSLYLQMQ